MTATWTASVESGDTAASGDLRGMLTGSLTFTPGQTSETFRVGARHDRIHEEDETFTVTLSGLSNATLTGGTATGTIEDDDFAPGMDIGDVNVDEGDTANFTATLRQESERTVTVNWTASVETGDTAESADLGSPLSGTLVFDPGETSKPVAVGTAEDLLDEDSETFTVTLTGGANATTSDATAQGTIVDDDAAPTLSVADASGSEGNSITFTVTQSAASAKTVTATWTASVASDDTAASGDLSGTLTGTLTFAPGEGTRTFTVATAEDTTDEPDETFTVTLSNLANATLTGGTATGTIVDDDSSPRLSVADARAAEGDAVSFTVTLAPASVQTVTVDYFTYLATGDTARQAEFTETSGSLSFAPGDTEKTVTVATNEDALDEFDETFSLSLTTPRGGRVSFRRGQAKATIVDDDDPPTLSVGDAGREEGDRITFTATLSAASGKPVTATWTASVESGDTAESDDLRGTLTGTLTFAPGEDTRTFTVATVQDSFIEVDETFTVRLRDLRNATLTGGAATGAIEDDDGARVLRIADASATEGSAIAFTVTLSPASGQTVTVDYATSVASGDTAATGDFTAKSGSLSFAPGATEKTFTVTTAGDAVAEEDETFTVTLSGPAGARLGDATATGTIEDDDDPPTLSVADADGSEGGGINFRATLSAVSEATVTATWTASVESGDTAASGDLTGTLTGTLTFAPGAITRTFTVATAEDTVDEVDETFTVTLSNLSNATLTGGTATGTIEDDDGAAVLRIADASAAEGSAIAFTVRLSPASGQTVTVNYATSVESGDTTNTIDFTRTSGSLSFSPGDTEKTFTVATTGDALDEVDETFTVTLSDPANVTVRGATATGTIVDDDDPPTLSVADASRSEGESIVFRVMKSVDSEKTVTATWTASVEGGDTAAIGELSGTLTGTVTFGPGQGTKTFRVATAEDTLDEEDETFTVTLSNLLNATLTGGAATGTIVDDDDPPTLSIADASAVEGNAITFTVTLAPASGQRVTVDYATTVESGDTATPDDFTAKSGSVSFAPGDTEKTFTVATTWDAVDEPDETFTVTLSGPANATLGDATATGTIEDPPMLSVADASGSEGDSITFTATLSAAIVETVTATWTASVESGDTAASGDLSGALTGTLTFAPGEDTKTFTVATAEDTTDEEDETFTVTLSGLSNATLTGGTATGTIEDDDDPPTLSVADASGSEGDAVSFTATLAAASAKPVTATWTASVESGDTAASGDLSGTLTGTLTFAAGDLTKTFTVATAEDTTDEEDETFTVTLSGLSNATLTGGTATGTIEDDDGAAVLRIADASAAEGSAVTFTVTLEPASGQTVTVDYATSVAPGDTAATGDFTAASGSLSFAPGDTEKTVTVATAGDAVDEIHDETFTVTLSGPANATLRGATATGTIVDDDDPPTLSVADASGSEGEGIAFTATLSAASGQTVAATWTASVESGDTAASGDLSGTLTGTLTFAPGEGARTFTVATAEDTTDEEDESFTVTLSNLSNARLTGGTATGTIEDDDGAPVLRIADASAAEGSAITFTVTLEPASGKTVTVDYATSVESGDTATAGDFTAKSGSLSFGPGDTEKTFTVATAEDTTDEVDETFTVTLSNLSNATLTDATAQGTIEDDDSAPTLSVADAGGSEGDSITFTATLAAASGQTVTATWTASVESGDTAASGDLSGTLTGTLSFAPGEGTRTFTVATAEDTTDEVDETFTVTLSGLSNATLTGGTATGTIEDDDGAAVLRIADASAAEGSAIAFTVTLAPASGQTVTVDYATSVAPGDTATTGDFTAKSGSLSFGPGDTEKTFTVTTAGDAVDEVDETFTVTLSAPSNATVSDTTAAGTIADDDTTTLRVSGPASAVTEGGDAVFTVTLSTPNSRDIGATYETRSSGSDPATHGEDYVPFGEGGEGPGSLSIAAGETSATVTVTTVDDRLDESQTERVALVLTDPRAGVSPNRVDLDFTEAGADTAAANITDNDAQPVVELVLDPASIGEDGGSARVTARMAGTVRSDRVTTVTVMAAAAPPGAAGDFAQSGSELRIAAGAADSTGTVTLTAVDNDTDAPDKSVTVSATVANARGATAPAAKTLPIVDDEDSPTVTLALSESSISEAGGTSVLTATLSHPSSEPTTVTVTPRAGSFTLAPANGRLTIAAGATAGAGSVNLTAVDNRTDAPDNGLTVTATAANTQGVHDDADGIELTIADEDAAPTPMLVLSQTSIGEAGAGATIRVTLTHPSSEATTVVLAAAGTVDRAAEFELAHTTLTVPAGAEQSAGSATIIAGTPNDTDAPDQLVTVSGTASNSQGIDGDPEAVELTIADDDAAPTVTLALASNPIAEENGSTAVTASLSHPSSEATTVTVTAAAVLPAVAGDFAQSGSVLTIAAGDLESTGTVTVTATPDFVDAADKTVRVSATAANTQGKAGDPANVNLTIADDDERGYVWSPETLNVEESAAVRYYMVALTSEPTADVEVTISDSGGDLVLMNPENFDAGSTLTLAFTPVNWNIEQRIGVTANSDSDSRNETIDLRHAGAGGDYQGYSDTYRVEVADDEKVANKVVLTVDPTEMEEGGGGRQVTVTASLDGARRTQATAVTVTAGPGSAEASDFAVSPASFTLTVPADGTDLNGSERRTVTLTPANDDIDEDDETVRFSGTTTATVENSTTVLTVDPAEVTIADDDTRGVTLSTAEVSPGEGGSATYTAVLDSAPTGPVTVTPAVTVNRLLVPVRAAAGWHLGRWRATRRSSRASSPT